MSEIAKSIVYCDTALEIWDELSQRFGKAMEPRYFRSRKSYAKFHKVTCLFRAISLRSSDSGMSPLI